jgi:hypothetical protein
MQLFMKEAFKNIFQDKIIFWSFLISVVLFVAIAIYIVIIYPQIPPVLPMYNRMSWGYSRLGGKITLFIPLGITLLFFIINTFAAAGLYNKVVLISRMISTISFTLVLCSSIYLLKLMQLIL